MSAIASYLVGPETQTVTAPSKSARFSLMILTKSLS